MRSQSKQRVLFEDLFDKPLSVEFTQPSQSSDGGVVLLRAIDEKMGLTLRMAQALRDRRQPGKVEHELQEMLRERVYGIACGYAECNEIARLSRDPAMKLACLRESEAARDGAKRQDMNLASQPTLSRFENAPSRTDLLRLAYAMTDMVIEQQKRRRRQGKVRRIVIDMDPTDDPTFGGQQLTFFNAYYDNWCYLPMLTTLQFDDETEQVLVVPVLRPGNAKGSLGAIGILKRLLPRVRAAFPEASVYVRMDGAFATPEVFEWLEAQGLQYVVNMAKNSVLKDLAEPLMKRVRRQVQKTGCTQREYGEARYQAGRWKRSRRVVIKAEVVVSPDEPDKEPRDNPRFTITNLKLAPKNVYRFYRQRGDMENRIKELKQGLRFDLTSCREFEANQFRNLLTAAAYMLYQQMRHEARGTECEKGQVWTLRERLIKIGMRVRETVRRIVLEAPRAYAWWTTWKRVAIQLGASP
jgi:hypothetical protein